MNFELNFSLHKQFCLATILAQEAVLCDLAIDYYRLYFIDLTKKRP